MPPQQTTPEIMQLGGRQWRPIQQPTLEHMIWMDRQVIEAGLDSIQQEKGETVNQFVARIWRKIALADKVFTFLGGMLLPNEIADQDWTPALAAETAAWFKKISAAEGQQQIRTHLVGLVLYFFVQGLGSFDSIGTASEATTEPGPESENENQSSPTLAPGEESSAT